MERRRSSWGSRTLVLVFASMLFVGLLAVPLSATSGDFDVSVDTTLTEDHSGRIRIIDDDVTLDCAGFRVVGPGSGDGITIDNRTNVTVRNCHVSGFDEGIDVFASTGVRLENNTVTGNSVNGIGVSSSTGGQVVGNTATANCTRVDFTCAGISLHSGTSGTVIDGNTVTDNVNTTPKGQAFGILVGGYGSGPTNATLSNNLVARNSHDGIHLGDADGNTIIGNTAIGNLRGGIDLHNGASNNVITDNVAISNTWSGFAVLGNVGVGSCDNNTLSGNWADSNDHGLELYEAVNNTITDNHFHQNRYQGILDQNTTPDSNTYTGNTCLRNKVWSSEPGGLCDPATSFTDDDGNTFEVDIEWMNYQGITRGCNPPDNDRYCPDRSVTRGQMAAFLGRALDLPAAPSAGFVDTVGTTFEKDIDRLAAAGITKGCNPPDNDRFCPDDRVRREVMAAFLVRALGYTDDGGGDLFVDDDTSIFEADIDKLATAGVTKGCNPPTNDRYCPKENVTRGQMAAFLRRALS